tara:strand:+ start:699 stop:1061 length:363 start_codon:yes stop_codon:yes gene_type:complete
LYAAQPLLNKGLHPVFIVSAYSQALEDSLKHLDTLSFEVDLDDRENMMKLLRSSLGTKFIRGHIDLFCGLALDATRIVTRDVDGTKDIDIKRYVKIEKVPGADISESCVVPGVVINKGEI